MKGLEKFLLGARPGRTLLAFDFDGTLAPIVEDPSRASVRPKTRVLLSKLCRKFPVAVISGRSRKDLGRLLEGAGLKRLQQKIGSHGMDWGGGRGLASVSRIRKEVARWAKVLKPEVEALEGVWLENKAYSLSVHYRNAPNPKRAKRDIARLIDRLVGPRSSCRVIGGKCVVNLVHASAADKGGALLLLTKRLRCDRAIFVGDDVTDEDVFRLGGRKGNLRIFGIRVGRSRKTRARHFILDQIGMDRLLQRLVDWENRFDEATES